MYKVDAASHVEVMERGRIFTFQHGLNLEYDRNRVSILGK